MIAAEIDDLATALLAASSLLLADGALAADACGTPRNAFDSVYCRSGEFSQADRELNQQFGTAAEFEEPKGGIFLWVKLPDNVDTMKLYQPALQAGVAINPGPEWSVNKAHSTSRMRLCFASPSHDEIRQGIAALAEVFHREFGVPARIANVKRG